MFHQHNMIKVVKTSLLPHDFHPFWLCFIIWLVVSTPLKNMLVKMGSNLPQIGVKRKKYLKPPSHCLLCILFSRYFKDLPMLCPRDSSGIDEGNAALAVWFTNRSFRKAFPTMPFYTTWKVDKKKGAILSYIGISRLASWNNPEKLENPCITKGVLSIFRVDFLM